MENGELALYLHVFVINYNINTLTEKVCLMLLGYQLSFIRPLVLIIFITSLAGCSLNPDKSKSQIADDFEQQKVSLDLVNDIPIPEGARLDTKASLVLGRGDRWTGRMVMNTSLPPTQAFALFQSQMPSYGWQVVLSVQDRSSNIVFIRGDRISNLTIHPLGLRGSRIIMLTSLRPVNVPSEGVFNAAPTGASDIGSGVSGDSDSVPLQ